MMILEPGFHKISDEEYHADTSCVTHSHLTAFEKAPRVYEWKYIKGNRGNDDTPAKVFGRQFHELLLDFKMDVVKFSEKYFTDSAIYIKTGEDRTRKPYKDAFKTFSEEHAGKILIKHKEWLALLGMMEALKKTIVAESLKIGDSEITIVWDDPVTGLRCKGKIDFKAHRFDKRYNKEVVIFLDPKSVDDASTRSFMYKALDYKWYRQAAYYLWGYEVLTQNKLAGFADIAIEKEPPHLYQMYEIHETWMYGGRTEFRRLLNDFAKCREKNVWPGLPGENSVEFLMAPESYIRQQQEELENA